MAKESLNHLDKHNIFREPFNGFSEIAKNGGTVNGNPTILNGVMTLDGTGDFIDGYPVKYGVKSVVLRLNPDTTTEDFIDFDGGTHSIEVGTGTITATGFSSPTIYVDGAATATMTAVQSHVVVTTATAFDATALKIGQETDTYAGTMEIVEIYDRVLTADEISALYKNSLYREPNTLSSEVFSIDTRLTGVIEDKYGNSITNTAVIVVQDGCKVMSFDGATANLAIPTADSLNFGTNDFVLECWFKVRQEPADTAGLLVKGVASSVDGNYGLMIDGVDFRAAMRDSTGFIGGTFTYTKGLWTHVIANFDRSGNLDIYINGALDSQTDISTHSSNVISNSNNLELGTGELIGNADLLDGNIALPKIYTTLLTAEEIARRYNSTKRYFNK